MRVAQLLSGPASQPAAPHRLDRLARSLAPPRAPARAPVRARALPTGAASLFSLPPTKMSAGVRVRVVSRDPYLEAFSAAGCAPPASRAAAARRRRGTRTERSSSRSRSRSRGRRRGHGVAAGAVQPRRFRSSLRAGLAGLAASTASSSSRRRSKTTTAEEESSRRRRRSSSSSGAAGAGAQRCRDRTEIAAAARRCGRQAAATAGA
jgi:hypothetical protein